METTQEPTPEASQNTQPRTPLEEKFANRIAECFLGAIDRIAENESENGENGEVSTDQVIAQLFIDNNHLSRLIGEAVDEFEALYFTMPKSKLWSPHSQDCENSF